MTRASRTWCGVWAVLLLLAGCGGGGGGGGGGEPVYFLALDGSGNFSVALQDDGSVWTWGDNSHGQLGTTADFLVEPTKVLPGQSFASLGAGSGQVLAIDESGGLWAWGGNWAGQLGTTGGNRYGPVAVGPPGAVWEAVAGGGCFSLALRSDGTIWSWGCNERGQLGDGTTSSHTTPAQVGTSTSWAKVAAGGDFSFGIKTDGSLWAWGRNDFSQLGDSTTDSPRTSPVRIGSWNDWVQVDGGGFHGTGLRSDGSLWAWGHNEFGQAGSTSAMYPSSPTQVAPLDTTWTAVSAGDYYTLVRKADGTLWAFGYNVKGQLGRTGVRYKRQPGQVFIPVAVSSATAAGSHGLAAGQDGSLWTWGSNAYGELGQGTRGNKDAPVLVGSGYVSIAAGASHSSAVRTDGSLLAWGNNWEGSCGTTGGSSSAPVKVGSRTDWDRSASGGDVTLAIDLDGNLWGFGDNLSSQLGTANTTYRFYLPISVHPTSGPWEDMDAGDNHVLARKADGSLWAWGANGSGQLGTGSPSAQIGPLQVAPADTTWAFMSGGSSHSLAIKADGSLWAWGENGSGQLGDGFTTDRTRPVRVGADNDWQQVSAGGNHSLGIRDDGSLWAWGWNTQSVLGTGSGTQTSPVQVAMAYTDWTAVGAGLWHSAGLRSDGSLWAWGVYGPRAWKGKPAELTSAGAPWVQLACGTSHTLLLNSAGELWALGYNDYGQLGDGTGFVAAATKVLP